MSWFGDGSSRGGMLGLGGNKRNCEGKAKENAALKNRTAFGNLTNQEEQGNVPGRGSEKADAKASKGKQNENLQARRAVLGSLNGTRQQATGSKFQDDDMDVATPSQNTLWVDIDQLDGCDPLACGHIANDIMANLFRAERTKRPLASYMACVQTDITASMREILTDWLVEVAQEYKLKADTLFQCVALVDRYLSRRRVQRNRLQLVGVTCMLLAAKYEEIYAPTVEDFCFITENTYSHDEVRSMELEILSALDFQLTTPSIRTFLRRFVKAAAASFPGGVVDSRLEPLSSYIAEMSLLDYDLLRFVPSMVAASAVLLAQACLSPAALWNPTLQHYTSYMAADLKECVVRQHDRLLGARTSVLPAIRDKYTTIQFSCVAASNPPPYLPATLFLA